MKPADRAHAGVSASRFAEHARRALEKHMPEARTGAAHWTFAVNEACVRIPAEDGRYFYFALRRPSVGDRRGRRLARAARAA
jgi:hypothetical protein